MESMVPVRFFMQQLAASVPVTGTVGTRIGQDPLPAGIAYPYIVISLLSAVDVGNPIGERRTGTVCRHLVAIVGKDVTFRVLEPTANAIDAALHRASGTVEGGRVTGCRRAVPFERTESIGDTNIRWLGGEYISDVVPT